MEMAVKPENEIEDTRRKANLLRQFVDRLNAQSPGITPKWRRAIENYQRLRDEKVSREP